MKKLFFFVLFVFIAFPVYAINLSASDCNRREAEYVVMIYKTIEKMREKGIYTRNFYYKFDCELGKFGSQVWFDVGLLDVNDSWIFE